MWLSCDWRHNVPQVLVITRPHIVWLWDYGYKCLSYLTRIIPPTITGHVCKVYTFLNHVVVFHVQNVTITVCISVLTVGSSCHRTCQVCMKLEFYHVVSASHKYVLPQCALFIFVCLTLPWNNLLNVSTTCTDIQTFHVAPSARRSDVSHSTCHVILPIIRNVPESWTISTNWS